MCPSRFTEEQIIGMLKKQEAARRAAALKECCQLNG